MSSINDNENNKIKLILNKYEKANSIKNSWNDIYNEIYSYVLTNRGSVYDYITDGEKQIERKKLFTSIAQSSANSFVNRIQQLITPINSDWLGLEAIDPFKENSNEIQEINKNLEAIANILNNLKNGSNFDSVITEFYYDLIAGTACLLVSPGDNTNPIIYKTIPFNQYCISESYDGIVREVYRKFSLKAEEIKYNWKIKDYDKEINIENKNINNETKNKLIEIIEAVNYNYETKLWDYYVIDKENNKIIYKRNYKNNPFIILRWNKASGEYYGRGVGMTALNDIKTLNMIMDYSLRVLAYQLPIFLAEKESFDDDFLIQPMAINFVQSNETNKPSITQLQVQGNNDITQYNITQFEMNIKKIMLDNTLPDNADVRSATEIAERSRELQQNLNSVFGRIVVDMLYPLTKRMIEVAQLFNYIDTSFDINKIDGYIFKVNIKTPLSNINKQQQQENILNTIQTLLSLDNSGGFLKRYLKIDDLFIDYLNNSSINKAFIKTIEEINNEDLEKQQKQQLETEEYINNQVNLSYLEEIAKTEGKREGERI